MSYNPAFVADESPLAHANGSDHDQSNGIKLISFKVLPKSSITKQPPQEALQEMQNQHQNQTLHHHHHNNHLHQADPQDIVLDIRNDVRREENDSSSVKRYSTNAAANRQQSKLSISASKQHQQQKQAHNKVSSSSPPVITQQQQQQQNCSSQSTNTKPFISNSKSSTNANLCMSTSSSLSLIDNPTLGSLTPSASSYSTTSSSIVSSSTGLCAAVECRDMRYDVGRGRNQKTILYNINVTVPEGSIYGLLGPSGCGKTTMLRCVVGRIKPKEGYVRVFGYRPNDSGSQIPGPAIGYMPQVNINHQLDDMKDRYLVVE